MSRAFLLNAAVGYGDLAQYWTAAVYRDEEAVKAKQKKLMELQEQAHREHPSDVDKITKIMQEEDPVFSYAIEGNYRVLYSYRPVEYIE